MTNKEKQLLLKDLCARLPYGVMVHVEHDWFEDEVPPYDALLTVEFHSILNNFSENPLTCCFIIKPYLRPMSSMTEEEYECFVDILKRSMVRHKCYDWHEQWIQTPSLEEWLNEHHFDYRGLIPMGLALEAPKDMYDLKNK